MFTKSNPTRVKVLLAILTVVVIAAVALELFVYH